MDAATKLPRPRAEFDRSEDASGAGAHSWSHVPCPHRAAPAAHGGRALKPRAEGESRSRAHAQHLTGVYDFTVIKSENIPPIRAICRLSLNLHKTLDFIGSNQGRGERKNARAKDVTLLPVSRIAVSPLTFEHASNPQAWRNG